MRAGCGYAWVGLMAPHSSHREDAWEQCEEVSRGAQSTHACTFQPKAGSAISVLVNVTRTHMLPTLSYFKEPFWLHEAGESQCHHSPCPAHRGHSVPFHRSDTCLSPTPTVLTDAPQLVQATVSQGRVSLQWLPPLELLAEQLDYQVRYAMENSHDWKVRPGQDTPSSPARLRC